MTDQPTARRAVRPRLHFTADHGWINDPYGIIWDGSRYHLFYQSLPDRTTWSPRCEWGHAVSPDLVHWRRLPSALVPKDGELGCWSGSCVLAHGEPVLIYTRIAGPDWGHGQVALALPERPIPGSGCGPVVTRWAVAAAPVIARPPDGLGIRAFRDPFVWRSPDGWRMLVGAGLAEGTGAALQYRSSDLRSWSYDGILAAGSDSAGVPTGTLWECPQLFQLGQDWILLVSVWEADTLRYVAAAVGTYDGLRFTARSWQRLTHGDSSYAMTAFTDRDGRRCVLSWLREEKATGQEPGAWAGAHSLASLIELDRGRLTLRPHPDVDGLGQRLTLWSDPDTELVGARTATTDTPVSLIFRPAEVSVVEVLDDDGPRLRVDVGAAGLRVRRPGWQRADSTLATLPGPIRLIVDADIVEVFAPGGYGAYRLRPGCQEATTVRLAGGDPGAAVVEQLSPSPGELLDEPAESR